VAQGGPAWALFRDVFGIVAGFLVSKEESLMSPKVHLLTGILMLGSFVPQSLAITGGQVDQKNTYRNVGAVVLAPEGHEPIVLFSGTLIHPRVLLTAGHCTVFLEQFPGRLPFCHVSFGKDALDESTSVEIERVITHPNFAPANSNDTGNTPHYNDVGVVILKKPVHNVPLAKLPYAGFLDDLKAAGLLREPDQGGTPFTVAGYGSTRDFPPPVGIDPDGLRRFAETEYLALTQAWLFTLMNPATDNGGTGYGDSGGPNFWVEPNGALTLVAITSRGDPNLVATNIAWRADIPETLDFVNSVLAATEK
jgi:hypothetical protein